MTHPPISDPPGFDELSKPEQIRYLEALWDRISQNDVDIPIPENHLEIAEQPANGALRLTPAFGARR